MSKFDRHAPDVLNRELGGGGPAWFLRLVVGYFDS